MKTPLFSIGQSVSIAISNGHRYSEGAYRVTGTMPNGGGPTRYRIKHELETFERAIDAIHLSAA